jgi:hypothetical protein
MLLFLNISSASVAIHCFVPSLDLTEWPQEHSVTGVTTRTYREDRKVGDEKRVATEPLQDKL